MGHYDFFSSFYDASTEKHYIEQRWATVEALDLTPGLAVLDLPCGTGQAFDGILREIPDGTLTGVDFSAGMLGKARKRAAKLGAEDRITLLQGDARTLSADALSAAGAPTSFDRLHVFLGLSAFPDWEAAFHNLWDLLKPGGRCVIVDVYAETLTFQGRMVNFTAKADITRTFWKPLEAIGANYERRELPSKPLHGGAIYLATATKGVV